mmetsp:Transcript_9824/g.20014  ORF Transcript_9824/g.20014 Transcript_9824/m.20014 type:complete len:199 (-) Transcript_9824:409-1005(-)
MAFLSAGGYLVEWERLNQVQRNRLGPWRVSVASSRVSVTVSASADLPGSLRDRPNTSGDGTSNTGPSPTELPSVGYNGIQHAGVLVSNLDRSRYFYQTILGMGDETHLRNPKLPFDGAFMKVGPSTQLHLMVLPNPDPLDGRPEHGGRDRHVAMVVSNIDPIISRLAAHGIPYTMSKSGRRSVFCRDYDSNALEFFEQ